MEITTQNIQGGMCPICGEIFANKFGYAVKNSVRNYALKVDTGSGVSNLRMRICREHFPLKESDEQWLLDCHKEYFKNTLKDIGWQKFSKEKISEWKVKKEVKI